MAKWFVAIALLLSTVAPAPAQRPFSGAPEIEQALHRLNQLGSVLMIAAHPDDERTAVLAYFARGRYMRTAYLSVTRGEGGQNLIGSEQGAQLGLIRTHELLDARQIDGAEQFFTRAIDFGFSKTAAETLQKWGHDRILSDVVWIIRSFRPDVVILCFSGTPRDGHGHHQSSAILGKEAFQVAADAQKFPEQLKYVKPWQARRLVHVGFGDFGRGGRGGRAPQQPAEPQLPRSGSADTGAFNPILGYSYDELAVLSRSMHHSQGTGAMRRPGPGAAEFELVSGDPASQDLFDGIDTSWNRLPGGASVHAKLTEAIRIYDPQHPDKVIPLLLEARPLIAQIADPAAVRKLRELDETVALCAGVWIEAQASQAEVTPGSSFTVTTTVLNRTNADVTVESASIEGFWSKANPISPPARLGSNKSSTAEFHVDVPASQPYTQPYWLLKAPSDGVYTVDDQRLVGLPEGPPALQARFKLTVAGTPIEIVRAVRYRYADRALGERERALAVVPAAAVNLPVSSALFPAAAPNTVHVAVRGHAPNTSGELRIELPAGWTAEPKSQPFQLHSGEQQELAFQVTPPAGESIGTLRAVATVGGREISAGMQNISYPHIPTQLLFPPSDLKLVRCDVHVTARRIGYIMGAGDEMPDALRQLGLEVTLLGPSDVEQGDLSRFDAIVAGVRAYNVRSDLRANHQRLMAYVKNGGTYVVQYQTAEGGGFGGPRGGQQAQPRGGPPPDAHIGPYPITVPGGNQYRITVEDAPVTFPQPDSRLLQAPNHISQREFEGWVQERGLYFATEWDKRYQTVLSATDPGEKSQEGGELWTHYGKGVYIFTAYSWFRQLPAGVPGAYRLFANLLSAK